MSVIAGTARTQVNVKVVKISRYPRTVTLEVLNDSPDGPTTLREGDTLVVDYVLNLQAVGESLRYLK